jgi:2-hydroxychromene-2-carboxylate isomerase
VLAEAETAGKAGLKENTDKAFANGAFGLPWMVATDSAGHTVAFWGVDHMGQLLQFLGIEKPGHGNWRSIL